MLFKRMGIRDVIVKHLGTFETNNDKQAAAREKRLIFGFALLISLACAWCNCLGESFIGYVLTAISILSGFLINALFVLTEKKTRGINNDDFRLYQETSYNISFGVLVGIAIILLSGFFFIINGHGLQKSGLIDNGLIRHVSYYVSFKSLFAFVYCFFLVIFIHTLLISLRSINYILEKKD